MSTSRTSNQRVSEKLTVEQALDMARRCRYLDNGPVCYDKTLYGAVWALADEVERLRSAHETTTPQPYRVRLLKDIFDDGQDHHPPGYVGRKGDVVVIHSIQTAVVSHHGTGHGFVVHDGELELIPPEEPADRILPAGWASMTPDQLAGAVIPKKRLHDQGSQSGETEPHLNIPGFAAPTAGTSAVNAGTRGSEKASDDPWTEERKNCTCPKPGTSNSQIDPMCPISFPHPWARPENGGDQHGS